jgi:parallel beta-helix repeat protein
MARINDGTLKDWKDGDKVTSDLYEADREILRVATNDNHDRITVLEVDKPIQDKRLDDLEYNTTGTVVPMTFKELGMQNLTFDDIKLGYVDKAIEKAWKPSLDGLTIGVVEEVTATNGQTVINLANSYTPGSFQLTVEIDGVPQDETSYTETSTTSITLSESLVAGQRVVVTIGKIDPNADARFSSLTTQMADKASKKKTDAWFDIVADFGAKGDGSTDDTTAIQAALDAVYSAGGGTVVVPSTGTFIFTTLKVKTNTTFKSYGGVLKIKNNVCVDSNALYYFINNISSQDTLTYYGYPNVILDNLKIDGNQANNTLYNVADPITICGDNVKVINCYIYNAPDSGIMFTNVKNSRCVNNRIDNCRDLGIYVNDGTGTSSSENTISGNIITRAQYGAISLKRISTKMIVSNNLIYDCGNGILLDFAIRVNSNDYSYNMTITNNRIRYIGFSYPTATGYGIMLKGGKNSIVTNNRIEKTFAQGIRLEGSSENIIANNIVEGDRTNGDLNKNSGIYLVSKTDENSILYNSDNNKILDNIVKICNRRGIEFSTSNIAGSVLTNNEVIGNTVSDTRTTGIFLDAGVTGGKFVRNVATDGIANDSGFEVTSGAKNFLFADNDCVNVFLLGVTEYANAGIYFTKQGTKKVTSTKNNAVPTGGTWAVGDRCDNHSGTIGQPKGWLCTTAGTPGTWTSLGNL